MKKQAHTQMKQFVKKYDFVLSTIPVSEGPDGRVQKVLASLSPVINQVISDAMEVAIGTWPVPEKDNLNPLNQETFSKQYTVMIDTVPVADRSVELVRIVTESIMPAISQIVTDAMTVAIGTWPTPEKPIIDVNKS